MREVERERSVRNNLKRHSFIDVSIDLSVEKKKTLSPTHVHEEHLELLERLGSNAWRDRRPGLGRRWGDRGHGFLQGGENKSLEEKMEERAEK